MCSNDLPADGEFIFIVNEKAFELNQSSSIKHIQFTNQKIKDETYINGFDKLIDAPLNKLKVDEIIEKYIEPYALQLTKIML